MSARAAPLRIGVVGLGRAFTLMLPTFVADARVRLVSAADPLPPAREQFTRDFGAPAYADVDRVCDDPGVDLVYIASPHQFHAAHARRALAAGKHVLVEKPMAMSLDECTSMIDAAQRASRCLIVGHSHSSDRPIERTRALIESGEYGALRMIVLLNYTDFLYRPRRPEELVTAQGGGVIFSQAAHQVDMARYLGGGLLSSLSAQAGAWDPARPTEGAYGVLMRFVDGAFAQATYSGYGHFDSDTLMGNVGELGQPVDPAGYGGARRRMAADTGAGDEAARKAARNYGGAGYQPAAPAAPSAWQHFGFVVASCERADFRPTPLGVEINADARRWFEPLAPPAYPRPEVIDEVVAALREGIPPRHDGRWARATLEACLAILRSAREQREVALDLQVPLQSGRR